MIIDHIRNRSLYYGLGEHYRTALDFIADYKDDSEEDLDILLVDPDVKILVRTLDTRLAEEAKPESHRKYADIHFTIKGGEKIGYADTAVLTEISADEEKDLWFYENDSTGDVVTVPEGYFLIALPDDAHTPLIRTNNCEKTRKIIAKIKL